MRSAVLSRERRALHACLVLEQLLGKSLVSPLKKQVLRSIEERLGTRAPGSRPEGAVVERRANLSPEEFHREYFLKGRAVIFDGAAKEWPCVKKWSFDFFSANHGEHDLLLVDAPGLTSRESRAGFEFLPLKELVESIRAGGDKYLRFSPLLHEFPALVKDLDMSWLEATRGGSTFASAYYMFIGGAGQRTYLHNDQPCNLFVQVSGEKKWTLYYPQESALLYPEVANTAYVKSPVNLSSPDLERHPLFLHATPVEAMLKPGDVLYVPPFVWHEVENLGETVAVGYRYSSVAAAVRSSLAFLLLRAFSTNPPIWKTMEYGKADTNLIWAHTGGFIQEVLNERANRKRLKGLQ